MYAGPSGFAYMPIDLPQLRSFSEMLTVCSRIDDDAAIAALPSDDYDITAGYTTPAGRALVRLVWNREKNRHLHIDVALRAAFDARAAPKTTGKIGVIRKLLACFDGVKVKATIAAAFRIPLSSLPPAGGLIFAGSSAIHLKVNKAAIEMTGAQFSLHNADISKLRWELIGDYIYVDLVSRRDVVVNREYLTNALTLSESALSVYVLGKVADVAPNI
jgi:hypothetical protein